jgi:hypothetical protein
MLNHCYPNKAKTVSSGIYPRIDCLHENRSVCSGKAPTPLLKEILRVSGRALNNKINPHRRDFIFEDEGRKK